MIKSVFKKIIVARACMMDWRAAEMGVTVI